MVSQTVSVTKADGQVVKENTKYRIVVYLVGDKSVFHFNIGLHNGMSFSLEIKDYAKLQVRRGIFGLFRSWVTVAVTNRYSVAQTWMDKYFKEPKNEKRKAKQTKQA